MSESGSVALAIAGEEQKGAIQLLLDLEANGEVDAVSLNLTDPDLPYETWEALGRFLGSLDRRSRWYLGDWLNFGEAVYGEAASQGVEATTAERYNEAERVTGLDHGTLMNVRSVCARVARSRRREELGFWIHAEVAPLDPEEQIAWLDRAVAEGWTRAELRDAIRESKNPTPAGDGDPPSAPGEPVLSISERIELAARRVYHQAQATAAGQVLVPAEPWAQLREALGEE
jgi:hypothetical protein